jgi:RNA polymerase sigma-70 factor, ECF subfamily
MTTSVNTALNIHCGGYTASRDFDASSPRAYKRRRAAPPAALSTRQNERPLSSPIHKYPSVDDTICRAQQGDAEAFETLYQLHSRRVYALCLRMIGDPVDAEDLTQEAFLQLFRKIHTFRGESAFSSWLYRLTANVVLMRFRKRKPVTISLDELTRADDGNEHALLEIGAPDLRLAGVFDRVKLHDALAQLPTGYKSMFLLHDVHGYEHNEIARLLGCSIGNSKSQLHKARKRLRQLLRAGRRRSAPSHPKAALRTEALGFLPQLENYAT